MKLVLIWLLPLVIATASKSASIDTKVINLFKQSQRSLLNGLMP